MKTIILLLTFLIMTIATIQFVNLANANPAPLFAFPMEPVTTTPMIIVHSPVQNQIFNSSNVWLNFSVVKPESWFAFNAGYHENGQPITDTFVNITSIYYILDNNRQAIPIHDIDSLYDTSPTLILNFSNILPLTTGIHTLKISLEATSYYWLGGNDWSTSHGTINLHTDSEIINFTKALNIQLLLPTNKTYDTSNIPLDFVVDEAVSKFTYSLDGLENVTISGNLTLTDLLNGKHNVTVYATDFAGNVGFAETSFTINKPEPFPTIPVTASIGIVTIVSVSLLIYFKKHKFNKTS